jgi:integrase
LANNGNSKYTIEATAKALSLLGRHANLENPEDVKQYIASKPTSAGHKRALCIAYNKYVKQHGLTWEMPRYKTEAKHVRIPTKEKLEMLIANASPTMATRLQLSMETGIRPIELCRLRAKDVDFDKRTIYPTTAKHGTARTLKMSTTLAEMLKAYVAKHTTDANEPIFKGDAENYGKYYRAMRNALADKLHDPTIRAIRLYDFRHYFATMTYHKTRDILFTKQQMGHQKIETTLIYAQLLDINDDEWTCRTAKTIEDATKLIEAGFDFITEMNEVKLFRKRK